MQDAEKIAALIEQAIMNQQNRIIGDDALSLLAAVQSLREPQIAAMKRKKELEADAKSESWDSVEVTLSGAEFWQFYAFMHDAKVFGCESDRDIPLVVYFSVDHSDDRPQMDLEYVVSPAPIVLRGEYCEHVVHAYQPLLQDMDEHTKWMVHGMAEIALEQLAREAA